MARPCDHPIGEPQPERCGVCAAYVRDPKYRALYDAPLERLPPIPPRPRTDPPPIHAGGSPPPGASLWRSEPPRASPRAPEHAALPGPGTGLKRLLASLGFRPCQECVALARQMDEWGVEGCQVPANREVILTQLRERQAKAGWLETARAGLLAAKGGLAWKLDWNDLAGSLLDESIRWAEDARSDASRRSPPTEAPLAATVPASFPLRDLAYHIWPVSGNGIWQRNVAQLARRWPLFTGRKIIAIATGGGMVDTGTGSTKRPGQADPPEAVEAEFARLGCTGVEFLHVPNDSRLREVATLVPLLERLESSEPGRALFYAHAKGVTRPVNLGVTVHPWADLLYESLLDYWPVVEGVLAEYPVAGSFRKLGHGFAGSRSQWHYSGSFWVARSADLFARNWREVDQMWWGSESAPSLWWHKNEAGLVFHTGKVGILDLYSMPYLQGTVLPAWEQWKAMHAHQRTQEIVS